MRSVQWNRPLEDRLSGTQIVRNAAARQRVAGQMLVRIDHARDDDTVGCVEFHSTGPHGAQPAGRPDIDDLLAADGDRAAHQHLASRVHGDDIPAGDDQVGGSVTPGVGYHVPGLMSGGGAPGGGR